MKKKLLNFVLAICLIIPCAFALSACDNKDNGDNKDKTIAPTQSYVIECLEKVPGVLDTQAATEITDPNNLLNKPGGYYASIYFSYSLVNQNELNGNTIIEKGVESGGCIEVYNTKADAEKREQYLAAFDGTFLATGTHKVVGTLVVRTSNELLASQQKLLESNIIAALNGNDSSINQNIGTPDFDNNNNDDNDNNGNDDNDDNDNDVIVCMHTNLKTLNEVKKTCTTSGLTEGKQCIDCEKIIVSQNIIPAGHTTVIDSAVSATCISTGLTEGSHCSECGDVIITQQVIPIKSHTFVSGYCNSCECEEYTDGLTFVEINGDYVVNGYNGSSDTIIIPSIYNKKKVVHINDSAFKDNTSIVNVIIGNNIPSMGVKVFYNCKYLRSITLSEKLTNINEYTFYNCSSLTDIVIPNLVEEIKSYSFSGCIKLSKVDFGTGLKTIGKYAFSNCTVLEYGSKYTKFEIPNTVERIDKGAFNSCSTLSSSGRIYIPSSVKYIECGAFTGFELNDIGFSDKNNWKFYESSSSKGTSIDLTYPNTVLTYLSKTYSGYLLKG